MTLRGAAFEPIDVEEIVRLVVVGNGAPTPPQQGRVTSIVAAVHPRIVRLVVDEIHAEFLSRAGEPT